MGGLVFRFPTDLELKDGGWYLIQYRLPFKRVEMRVARWDDEHDTWYRTDGFRVAERVKAAAEIDPPFTLEALEEFDSVKKFPEHEPNPKCPACFGSGIIDGVHDCACKYT